MLNINKINRVKGILSARDGTLVPKFFDGGVADWYRNYDKALFSSPKALVTEDWLKENDADAWGVWNKHILTEKEKAEAAEANNPAYTEKAKVLSLELSQPSTYSGETSPEVKNNKPITSTITDKGLEFSTNPDALKPTKIKMPSPEDKKFDKIGVEPQLIGGETSDNKMSGDRELIQVPETEEIPTSTAGSKKLTSTQVGNLASGVGTGIDMASNLFVDKTEFANEDPTLGKGRQLYDSVANSLMAFSPVGTIAGGAMKAIGLANDMLGSKADSFAIDLETMNAVGGSYGGTSAELTSAAAKAGKKYGLFASGARKTANKEIAEAKIKQEIMSGIADEASDRKAGAQDRIILQQSLAYERNMTGGYDLRYLRAAKSGTKILYFKEPFKVNLSDIGDFKIELTPTTSILKNGGAIIDTISAKYTNKFEVSLTDPIDLEMFKLGGNISEKIIDVIETNTTQKSVIPEGALHKNKHHLDEVGIDDSELTKKGIPVVDNDGDQLAEIELNEIIFTLEVTKELESRYKEFYEENVSESRKNELAIEAGKLLWKEILYNTDDRTGLIDTLKLGGVIKALDGIQMPDALRITRNTEKEIPKNISDKKFNEFLKTLPDNQRNYSEDTYRMYRYWELNGKPKNFKEAIEKNMFTLEDDGFYHARSVAYNPELDEYEFMKMPGHKTTWMEEEGWYNGMNFTPKKGLTEEQAGGIKSNYVLTPKKGREAEESRRFREKYELDKSGSFWKYVPKNRKNIKKNNQGGNITQDDVNLMVKLALLNLLK